MKTLKKGTILYRGFKKTSEADQRKDKNEFFGYWFGLDKEYAEKYLQYWSAAHKHKNYSELHTYNLVEAQLTEDINLLDDDEFVDFYNENLFKKYENHFEEFISNFSKCYADTKFYDKKINNKFQSYFQIEMLYGDIYKEEARYYFIRDLKNIYQETGKNGSVFHQPGYDEIVLINPEKYLLVKNISQSYFNISSPTAN